MAPVAIGELAFKAMTTKGVAGAEAQSRTGDTSIFSAVLYQLSYLGRQVIVRKHERGCQGAQGRGALHGHSHRA